MNFQNSYINLKRLHINIPFAYALEHMPSYAKFMKYILLKKFSNDETITLIENCSIILDKKIPPKLKDLGDFNISCTIGNTHFEKTLCDLGACINSMPLLIFKRFK